MLVCVRYVSHIPSRFYIYPLLAMMLTLTDSGSLIKHIQSQRNSDDFTTGSRIVGIGLNFVFRVCLPF
jgi:hypothetical protein